MIGGLFFSDADCCPLDFFDFFCDDDDIFSVVARSITDTDYSLSQCLSLPLSLSSGTDGGVPGRLLLLPRLRLRLLESVLASCSSMHFLVVHRSSWELSVPCAADVSGHCSGRVRGTCGRYNWLQGKGNQGCCCSCLAGLSVSAEAHEYVDVRSFSPVVHSMTGPGKSTAFEGG